MKARFIAIVLLAFVAGTAAAADEPKPPPASEPATPPVAEPIRCYSAVRLMYGQGSIGMAIELCGGTTDAEATMACYTDAVRSKESGGLGLDIGSAIELCRPAGAPRRK